MNKVLIIVFIIFFSSCKKEAKSLEKTNKDTTAIQNDTLKKKKNTTVSSSKFIDNWAEIIAFEQELKKVLTVKIQSEKDIELLKKQLVALKKTIPEQFKNPAIEARIKVLETEILMLNQELKDGSLINTEKRVLKIQKNYNTFVGQIEALIIKEKDYEKYN